MVVIRNLLSACCFFILISASLIGKECILETIYGTTIVSDPLILELLETPSLQRMKQIDQHGLYYFRKDSPTFNRYEHSRTPAKSHKILNYCIMLAA